MQRIAPTAVGTFLTGAGKVETDPLASGLRARPAIDGLYVVTDDTLVPGRSHEDVAAAAVAGGARVIQLRDKRRETGELIAVARRLKAILRPFGALLIINDRVDVAMASGADGVHLGLSDMSLLDARRLLGPSPLIGFSPKTEEQAAGAAGAGADYLGVGALYETQTKSDAGPAVGLRRVAQFRDLSGLPIVGIGGITPERVPGILAAGAVSVAVVSAVVAAADPQAAARRLVEAIERGRYPG